MSEALAFLSAAMGVLGLVSLLPAGSGGGGVRGRVAVLASSLGRRLGTRLRVPGELGGRLAAAGFPGGLAVRDVMATKVACSVLATFVAMPFAAVLPGRLGLLGMALAPAAGFMGPDLWLARRARIRAAAIRRELPAMLDLLRVTVESGASLAAALGDVGERTGGPLGLEWRAVGYEAALGVPLGCSLAGLVERAPLPELRALTAALERAARHGAPLGSALEAQARDARLARRRRIQEAAARAAPKIQLVVALLLVPSVLLLVAAALAAALLSGGGPAF